MAQPILTFNTTFNRNTGKIVVTDTTNYLSYGIDISNPANFVEGRLKITYTTSSGVSVLYDNLTGVTPDIEAVGGVLVWNGNINIPLTTTGEPLPAEYQVYYEVYCGFDGNGDDFTVNNTNTYTYNMVDPAVCIEVVIDCATSTATTTDTTVYNIPNASVVSIVRAHTQYPPPASGYAINGPFNLITVTYSPIVTTTWTAEVISTVTYLLTSGLYVIIDLTGIKEFQVLCDTNLSKILCCLTDLQKQYEALQCTNPVKAENFKVNRLDPTQQHLLLFLAAQTSGNQTKMDQQYAAILEVSGCSESCNCSGSTPTAVSPSQGGPAALFNIDSPLTTIQVTSTQAGNLTTFHLDVSTTIQNAVNSFLTNPLGYSYSSKQLIIDTTAVGVLPNDYLSITQTNIAAVGPNIKPTGVHGVFLGNNSPNTATDFAEILVYNFLVNPLLPANFTAQVMTRSLPNQANTIMYDIACEILYWDTLNSVLQLRLVNPISGQPLKLSDLTNGGYNQIYITLLINSQ
jgi:hypothetical protein